MSDLSNLIRRESSYGDGARSHVRIAEVTSYNKKTHAAKLKLMPEGTETGWAPLGASHIGNGFGIAVGAKAGDQVLVAFVEGDHNTPVVISRLYSDQQRPPEVEGGEMVLFHESGGKLYFDKDGGITVKHKSGGSLLWDKDGKVSLDNGTRDVAIKGNVGING
ncbi:phage baseplate assembly protein V [Methylobacterium sp. Gmos1]